MAALCHSCICSSTSASCCTRRPISWLRTSSVRQHLPTALHTRTGLPQTPNGVGYDPGDVLAPLFRVAQASRLRRAGKSSCRASKPTATGLRCLPPAALPR